MKQFLDQYLKGDRVIWMVALFLSILSVLAVYSSIVTLAYNFRGGNTEYYLFKHSLMIVSGLVLMYYAHKLKYKYYSRLSQVGIWVAVFLLVLTLAVGVNINEASRWLQIPIIDQNFQTSDLAKITLVVYVARLLSLKQDCIKSFKEGVVPVMVPVLLVCALILPANFSTAASLFVTCLVIMFIGRVAIKHLLLIVGGAAAGFALLILVASLQPGLLPRLDTWKARVVSYSKDEKKEEVENYQVERAKIAIATGGFFGKGPSNGSSRNFLPHPYSDMIYAFVIEEYGSIFGGLGVLLLYLILLFRSVRIASKAPGKFGTFVSIGLSFSLVFQAMINMAVAVNLVPVTGQPLPLVSMGGTSIWFTCIAIGIILSVSRSIQEEQKEDFSHALA